MKLQIFLFAIVFGVGSLFTGNVQAQADLWDTSGNNIFNTNTGNVGIGNGNSFNPLNKFTVQNQGPANALLHSVYSGTADQTLGAFRIINPAADGGSNHQFFMGMRKWGGDYDLVQSVFVEGFGWAEFSAFLFSSRNYEIRSGINDFLIKNSGGVGIGVESIPDGVKLAVNGKLNAKEIEVTLDGWSDFVFDDDYKLKSLYEVEKFILNNRHLPDVPSETEVLANGVNLGEMSALLLQKIEELTLYVIELNKQNELLQKKIAELEIK